MSTSDFPIKTIALAGNPNCGKTTLFNAFTKLRQKVGNYSGVTVEKKTGALVLASDRVINVIDLPGTYSLAVRSPDEQVARDVLLGKLTDTPKPDLVVCVVDAGNLERNLYLVTQIQDLGLPIIIALNMMDEVERQGRSIDIKKLSSLLGVPIYPITANQGQGLEELKEAIAKGTKVNYRRQWRMAPDLEEDVAHLTRLLMHHEALNEQEAFSEALVLLSVWPNLKNDAKQNAIKRFHKAECLGQIEAIQERLRLKGLRAKTAAIEARYDWIKHVFKECVLQKNKLGPDVSERIDAVLTHRVFGWLIFLGAMALMFYMIFTFASYPMDFIDSQFANIGSWVSAIMPDGDLKNLLVNGVIAGVGGVVIFLPQILILYFFIGLLQDTGYMARAAFIMDRVMSKFGLHGKSFIPLLSSFACAIPGIMSARTIESPKDRLVTILVAPLMSCSARLPVYAILIAVLMPFANSFQKAGVLLIMYILGIVGACLMALIFKKTLLRSQRPVFVMELPPYRFPSWKTIMLQMWERAGLFIKRAGTVILAISIILWALMTYPKHPELSPSDALKSSYAGSLGVAIEPIIQPLGYDWRIGIGLIGSFAAREVFVSTMSIVFNLDNDSNQDTLREAFQHAKRPNQQLLFTPLVCLSLMTFYVFAMQCLSTVVIVARETNSWKWPMFQFIYMGLLAYAMAFVVFQGGKLLGFN